MGAVPFVLAPDGSLAETAKPSGTAAMAARLLELSRRADFRFNSFLNDRRVAMIRAVPAPSAPQDQVRYHFMLGSEQLLAGDAAGAVASFDIAARALDAHPELPFGAATRLNLREQLALSLLRLGEQENCILGHNSDRCLLPIRDAGVHTIERGSRGAIAAYTALLAESPDDLSYRWLLNLAYMTLGEHPTKVPPAWLIPAAAFASPYDVGRFPDVAPALGLDVFGLAGGVVMDDLDGDGALDLLVSGWGFEEQIRLFLNRRDGSFGERTEEAGLTGIVGGLNLVQADYDNDGDLDVFVLRGAWLAEHGRFPNSLLRNEGGGRFSDVTEEAGLLSFFPTQTAAWADFDGDGHLDLFIGNETGVRSMAATGGGASPAAEPYPCELYRNNGDGTFREVAAEAGVAFVGFVKAAVAGDVDNDGDADLFLSVMGAANKLFENATDDGGRLRFRDVSARAGVEQPIPSFPAWFFDVDNDGWQDLYVAGYRGSVADVAAEYLGMPLRAEPPRLYRNLGDGTFVDVAEGMDLHKLMLPMGCNFGDLDNDGRLDFYVATGDTEYRSLMPNRMFRNAGDRFQDVTTSGGFGHLQKGHGVAFGDLDNDGDQDVYAVMGGAHSGDGYHNALFENPGHGNRWVTLRLEGVTANRSAIGARIAVTVAEGDGHRRIFATVGSGGSFGANSLQQEIGLGQAREIVSIAVTWPGTTEPQQLPPVAMDAVYRVRQGVDAAIPVEVPRLTLGGRETAGHHHAGG